MTLITPESENAGPVARDAEYVFRAQGLTKTFGHVKAITDVDLDLKRGEVLALFGDNGAGKSTLTKMLCGVYTPDAGGVEIDGETVAMRSTRDAEDHGITVVHQDLALAPHLTVLENMFLGHEIKAKGILGGLGVLSRKAMALKTNVALEKLSIRLPSLSVAVQDLSGGQRQAVAVARASMWSRSGILMDEPTAALGTIQSDIVCQLIRNTADSGMGVMVISHDIPRILDIADRVVVLRHGSIALNQPIGNLTRSDVVAAMVGLAGDPADEELNK
ncbi:sugar ABC transporter ATP-binding protein [Herbiconiux sp. L3-i23]|nr:sugar ABC transporter ATP-binding protein [Herbiconiux sp. L3-i23]